MRWWNSIVPVWTCASSILRQALLPARTTGATRRSTTGCIRATSTASPPRTSTAAALRTIMFSIGATTVWPRRCARSTQRASPIRARDATPQRAAPAVLDVPGRGRVLVFSYGSLTSGVPRECAATAHRPGVNFLEDISKKTARRIAREMRGFNGQRDVIVASIHWGGNWDYHIRAEEIRFAHQLIDHGIAIVYGHSSHHVKTAEIYSGRLVLYGCGDLMNDYEGISGYEEFRSDLTLLYLPAIDLRRGQLVEARLVPMRVARLRLNRVAEAEAKWLCDLLNRLGAPLGTRGELAPDHTITLYPST